METIERLKRVRTEAVGPRTVRLSASRVRPGSVLHVEVSRRRWDAPDCIWHEQPLLYPARHPQATTTTVTFVERQLTPLTAGTRTDIILWTQDGVLICTPCRMLSVLRDTAPIWPELDKS